MSIDFELWTVQRRGVHNHITLTRRWVPNYITFPTRGPIEKHKKNYYIDFKLLNLQMIWEQ